MGQPGAVGGIVSTVNELWGCVVVAQLGAQAAVRLRSALQHAAVVLMEGARPLERVCGLNAAARAMGLREGMSRVEVETFDGVTVLPHSSTEEASARTILLQAVSSFSPRVEERVCGADWECIVDLSGTERLLGNPQAVGEGMVVQLKHLQFTACVAIAGNADAGLSLARHAAWTAANVPVQAVAAGGEAKELSRLPLDVLRLNQEMAERFAIWGIATLGELAALPETALITRTGQQGKQLRLRAQGRLPHLLQPVVEAFSLEETIELEDPVEMLEPLLFVLNPMLEQLVMRAGSRALALAAVTISLRIEEPVDRELACEQAASPLGGHEHPVHERTIRPAVPTLHRALLLKMLQLDLEAHPAPGAVTRICLSAEPGDPSRVQLGLFAPQQPEPTRFEDTYARLMALAGERHVGRVRLLDTHAPENFVLERFVLPEAGYKAPPALQEGAQPVTALRRMLPGAVKVQMHGSEIVCFWLESRRYEVLRCFGPWRGSGDWWCGQVWSLDTWDVAAREVLDGELLICVLGHDLLRNCWVLAGVYD